MLPIAHLLHKTVVRKFYERNTGFLLFVFFLMFGVVESTQIVIYHLSLIYGIIQSTLFLLIVCTVWALYIFKCFFFVSEFIAKHENSFFLQLNLLSYQKRIGWLFYILVLVDLPVIIYTSVIIAISIRQEFYGVAALIVSFHLLLLSAASVALERKVNSLTPPSFQWPSIRLNFPLPFHFYYLSGLLHQHKPVLVFTKAFSFFAIIGFMNIPLDHYEYRTALMGLLFGIAAHAVIVFEFRKLEDRYLVFTRQLPLHLFKRFINLVLVYAIVLLPELVLIMVNPIKVIDGLIIYFAGLSSLVFSHCSFFKQQLNMDKHIPRVLILFLVGFGLTLFKLAFPAALLLFFFACYKFYKNYYLYEVSDNL